MSAPPREDASASRLVRAEILPLDVVCRDAFTAADLQHWNSDNLDLLHAAAAFEDAPRDGRDDHNPLAQELAKLDAKLRLILRLIGRQAAATLPAARELRFGGAGLEWLGPSPGPAGAHALAELYISTVILEPLRLPGELAGGAGEPWQSLRYVGISRPVVDAIEKHVFLHHRRAIALARQQQEP